KYTKPDDPDTPTAKQIFPAFPAIVIPRPQPRKLNRLTPPPASPAVGLDASANPEQARERARKCWQRLLRHFGKPLVMFSRRHAEDFSRSLRTRSDIIAVRYGGESMRVFGPGQVDMGTQTIGSK